MTDNSKDIDDLLRTEAEAVETNSDAPLKPDTVITRHGQRSRVYTIRLAEIRDNCT